MNQEPTVSQKPTSANTLFRARCWLLPVALAACELAVAGLPAPPAGGTPPAATRAAGASAPTAPMLADVSRQSWQGMALGDIAAASTRWLLSIPLGADPLASTETGVNCGINQSGPVWFLAAPGGGATPYSRTCTVPTGKALVMAVASYLNDYPCPDPSFQPAPGQSVEDFLRSGAAFVVDGTTFASAALDNKPLRLRRVASGVFSFTAAASLQAYDSCLTGSPQLGAVDGLFVFIEPPSPGMHILEVRSINTYYGMTQGTFILNVGK